MAANGTVTIKVQANDQELKTLVKGIQDLKKQFDGLSKINPFEAIAKGAEHARTSLLGVSDTSADVSKSIDNIDSKALDNVIQSADKADSGLDNLIYTASDVDSEINGIDSDAIQLIGTTADRADGDLSDLVYTAEDVDSAIASIDADNVDGVGKSADKASGEMDDMGQSAGKASDEIKSIDKKPIDDAEKSSKKLSFSLLDFAKAVGIVKLVSVGFDMLTGSIDGAINRFDTFNTFPRTMEGLGYSTDQADRAIRRLDQGTRGLPTTLDGIVSSVQRIASVTGDLNLATDTALALNNAFLASGSSASDAARGTEQYVQMLSKGEADLQSYRTLQETMTLALNKTAESFGFAGESAQTDFYAALKNGDITFREFNSRLIELSNAQGGFAELAKTNSESLRTSWSNLRTAFVRNTANMLTKLDELSNALTGKSIAQNVDGLQSIINKAFSTMGKSIDLVAPIVIGTANAFQVLYDVTQPLHPVLKAAGSAMLTWMVLGKIIPLIHKSTAATAAYVISTNALAFSKKALSASYVILTGSMTIGNKVVALATAGFNLFNGALLTTTVIAGGIILGIGLLVGGFVLLKNILGKTSPELSVLTDEAKEAADATDGLTDSIKGSAESYESTQNRIEGQVNSLRTLASETVALADAERSNAITKRDLKNNIEELNGALDGLNLAYNEETGSLNISNEALQARLNLYEAEQKEVAARERITEIEEERAEAMKQSEENTRLLTETEKQLDEDRQGAIGTMAGWFGAHKEAEEALEELTAAQNRNGESIQDLAFEQAEAQAQINQAAREAEDARREQVANFGISMDIMTDKQREVAETMKGTYDEMVSNTQDAFSRMNEESSVSADEMIANLEHNAKMTKEWGDNRAQLMEVASQDGNAGFLKWLEGLGPDSAAELAVVADMGDTELQRFIDLMNEAPQTASEAFSTSLGEGMEEAGNVMIEGWQNAETSLKDAIEGAGFEEYGRMVGEGAAKGVKDSTADVGDATIDMAKTADKNFAGQLGIHSPSRVFIGHGSDIVAGLLQGISSSSPQVLTSVNQLADGINKAFTQSLKSINTTSISGWKQLGNTISQSFKGMNQNVRTETTAINNQMKQSMQQMNQTATTGTRQITTTYQRSYQQIRTNTEREQRAMVQSTQRNVQAQLQATQTGYNAMRSATQLNLNNMVGVTRSTMSQATAIMNSTASQARYAGQNMGLGFRNGLASTTGGILNTARSIANSAANTIKSALKIHSPSRVTTALGQFTGDGLIEGMKNRVRDVEKIAGEMAQKALPQIDVGRSLGLVGATGMAGNIYNNNQSYTLNANNSGTSNFSREDLQRLFKEFAWYIKQEGGALDG